MNNWLSDNFIEIFGAVTGIIYVFLEIRQTIWLWPLGLATSAAYVWIFMSSKLYADMSLQSYYVVISVLGWYWWIRGAGRRTQDTGQSGLLVTRVRARVAALLFVTFVTIWAAMYFVLIKLTDSPVPGLDAFITSLSVIGTWMLARKIYEHWYIWIIVNFVSIILYFTRGLYPTVVLYIIYLIMSFTGLRIWKKSIYYESINIT